MDTVVLGRTGLRVSRTAFGALPIQRIPFAESTAILRRAHAAGINFFDTARAYTTSEEAIGLALSGVRDEIILATKSQARTPAALREELETSLRKLKTDRIDVYQFHFVQTLPDPDDPDSIYGAALQAQREGKIRFIGLTAHRLEVALAAAESGRYDTVQFPLSAIASPGDLGLIELCARRNVGLIAMKGLCGGLITDARAAFAFLRQYPNVVPIWGIQRMAELEEFLALEENPPLLDAAMQARIERCRAELGGDFCRGCGYCLPCPAEIPINNAARMSLLLRRMPSAQFLTPEWNEMMHRIEDCTGCGHCRDHCPYGLDTPALLQKNLADYETFPVA